MVRAHALGHTIHLSRAHSVSYASATSLTARVCIHHPTVSSSIRRRDRGDESPALSITHAAHAIPLESVNLALDIAGKLSHLRSHLDFSLSLHPWPKPALRPIE